MKKNFLLLIVLVFATYSSSNVSAKDLRQKESGKVVLHNPGPGKNIPPQVSAALQDLLSRRFDLGEYDPTLRRYNIEWSRHKNIFHVEVTWLKACSTTSLETEANLSASIKANGDVSDISFIWINGECGGPIPL